MTHAEDATHARRPRSRRIPIKRRAGATAVLLVLAALAGGCGSNGPGVPNESNTSNQSTGSSNGAYAQVLAYSRCMRSRGIHDFPDPTTSPGGGWAIQTHGGPTSDLDHNNPTYQAADRKCHKLMPAGSQAAAPAAKKLAADVKWASCIVHTASQPSPTPTHRARSTVAESTRTPPHSPQQAKPAGRSTRDLHPYTPNRGAAQPT